MAIRVTTTKTSQRKSIKQTKTHDTTPCAIATNDAIRDVSACKPWCCGSDPCKRPNVFVFVLLLLLPFIISLLFGWFVCVFCTFFFSFSCAFRRFVKMLVAQCLFLSLCVLWMSMNERSRVVEQFTAAAKLPLIRQNKISDDSWLFRFFCTVFFCICVSFRFDSVNRGA